MPKNSHHRPSEKSIHTLGLTSVDNARDLGGYCTTHGQTVKYKKLLRMGKLSAISQEDIQRLRAEDVTLVLDLRTTQEITDFPDIHIPGAQYLSLKILDENAKDESRLMSSQYVNAIDSVQGLVDLIASGRLTDNLYTGILSSTYMQTQYRTFFKQILANADHSTVFHCTGGKDRTGIAAVLLLTALGVDQETCLADFALTNLFYQEKIEAVLAQTKHLTEEPKILAGAAALIGVDPIYMEKLFNESKSQYGSMMNFLVQGIGLTHDDFISLRKNFLE
ncbi:tyrosine-protein phosphatase [Eubacterium barkeri]|uniref:Protein-tyrosine phosphatase n=1 Tax=Eubacterium barkeri TaxID=1528 RepID=A0A1H3FQN7_EUBBA|nr:tyrosine-protein phosphatase [Eubacterium barkeri]SDX92464.1 protein-tyrosine phosphatase [Eubacterium barkeri]